MAFAIYINDLPKRRNNLPSRNNLRRDANLKGEISRKTGFLMQEKRGSKLRPWRGDHRLFTEEMWAWLTDEEGGVSAPTTPKKKRKSAYDGVAADEGVEMPPAPKKRKVEFSETSGAETGGLGDAVARGPEGVVGSGGEAPTSCDGVLETTGGDGGFGERLLAAGGGVAVPETSD